MFEYFSLLGHLRLPHWLILAGVVLVLLGTIGIVVAGSRRARPEAHEVAPERER